MYLGGCSSAKASPAARRWGDVATSHAGCAAQPILSPEATMCVRCLRISLKFACTWVSGRYNTGLALRVGSPIGPRGEGLEPGPFNNITKVPGFFLGWLSPVQEAPGPLVALSTSQPRM